MLAPLVTLLLLAGKEQVVQTVEQTPEVKAVRLTSTVTIDGSLDEAVWSEAPAVSAFTQRDPQEGAAPSEPTEVRLAYDDQALYVGARMLDSTPKGIVSRLG